MLLFGLKIMRREVLGLGLDHNFGLNFRGKLIGLLGSAMEGKNTRVMSG